MTYQEIRERLTKCENTLESLKNGSYKNNTSIDVKETTHKLEMLRESLQSQLLEAEKGMVATDDENKAKELADKGVNVKLTSEMKPGDPEDLERKRMERLTPKDQETIAKIYALMQNANKMEGEESDDDIPAIDRMYNSDDWVKAQQDAQEGTDVDADGGDLDVGHQDDEPNMLKKDIYDIATYAAKLYKQLNKYDQHDGEVDFPQWWQKKVILAREYMSAAQHYLEAEEKQPALDQLALEEGVEEGIGNKIIDKVKNLVKKNISKLGTDTIADIKAKVEKALGKPISSLGMSDVNMDNAKKVAAQFGLNEASLADKYPKFFVALGLGGLATAIGFGTAGIASGPMVLVGMAAMIVSFLSTVEMDEASANKIKKEYDELVGKMKQLAQHYKTAEGEAKAKIVAALKQHTARKKELEAQLDQAVAGTGAGQELDANVAEGRGNFQEIDSVIRDIAADFDDDEVSAAMEVMEYIGQEYGIDFEFGAGPSRQMQEAKGGKHVVRPCSAKNTPWAVWKTSADGENDKRIKGFKTKPEAQKFADEKNGSK